MTITEKIEAIRQVPGQLQAALEGLTDEQLDTPYREGGWTPRQVVHHIADSHMHAFIRMKKMLVEDHPTLQPYSQDDWADGFDYRYDVTPSLAIITGLQTRMADMFDGAQEDDWERFAYHPENGEMTFGSMLDRYADHGSNHVNQILDLRKRMGW